VFALSAIGIFKQKFIKLVAVIVYARLERKVGSLRKLNQFNIIEASVLCTETVNLLFYLCGYGNLCNRVGIDALVAGSADIDIDSSI
jgi:hypothetical protein